MVQERDLTGKTILVTGATSGIGHAAARLLAARGAALIGVGRSPARSDAARAALLTETPDAGVTFFSADLASQRQVRALAAAVTAHLEARGSGHLDALINNAGTVSSWFVATEDGYELQFAVNHLAPFLLTHALLPLLERAPSARVVMVSSGSHFNTRMHWPDVMLRRGYACLKAYKQSKLANILFTAELNRRLGEDSPVRAYAADPGLVNTEIGLKGTGGLEQWVWRRRRADGVSPEQSAASLVFLAADPSLEGARDLYWKDGRPAEPSRCALRADEAARLWALSERLCGITWGAAQAPGCTAGAPGGSQQHVSSPAALFPAP